MTGNVTEFTATDKIQEPNELKKGHIELLTGDTGTVESASNLPARGYPEVYFSPRESITITQAEITTDDKFPEKIEFPKGWIGRAKRARKRWMNENPY